jgi:hypothetical protein
MKTTVRLRSELLKRARERAAADGRTLTSLIKVKLPVSRARGGLLPGVDFTHSGDLEDLMNSK